MKYKQNRWKKFSEISWMTFAMSVVTIGIMGENIYRKVKKFKK